MRNNQDFETMGRIPPQAVDLETFILGAFLLDKNTTGFIMDIKPEMFYDDKNAIVFSAIKSLCDSSLPIDLLTVTDKLRKFGKLEEAGGPYYITTLTNSVLSAAHIEHHIKIVHEKFMQRELIRLGYMLQNFGYDDTEDVFEAIDKGKAEFEKILDGVASVEVKTFLNETVGILNHDKQEKQIEIFPGMGIQSYDAIVASLPGNLHITSGRPGMGKTAFALHKAKNEALAGKPILIWSYEMTARELVARALAESGVGFKNIITKKFDNNCTVLLLNTAKKYDAAPIFIIDDATIDMKRLFSISRKLCREEGIEKIYADHLKLIPIKGFRDTYEATSEKSRLFKVMAKELDIPVELLVQLSRKVEERGNLFKPMISDLRDSGSIEENADTITMLWRPEYYYHQGNAKMMEVKNLAGKNICSAGYVEAIVGKNRNGSPGVAMMSFEGAKFMFTDFVERLKHTYNPNIDEESYGEEPSPF